MPEILQRMRLPCSASEAKSSYAKIFGAQTQTERSPGLLQLALRVPVMLPSLEGEVVFQRDILVSLSPGRSAHSDLSVDWEPAGGGLYPRFSGILRTEDFGLTSCAVVLEGDSGLTNSGLAASEIAHGYHTATSIARMVLHEVRSMLGAFGSGEPKLRAM